MSKKVAVGMVAIVAALDLFDSFACGATQTIAGQVISAEPSANTLVIHAQGQDMTFRVIEKTAKMVGYLFTGFLEEPDTTVSDWEKAARAFANLKPGDNVTVSYTEADGTLLAHSVTKR